MMKKLTRREFMKLGLAGGAWLAMGGSNPGPVFAVPGSRDTAKKMIILGFDGMDPNILKGLLDEGKLPHFQKLRADGGFSPLGTSCPPQSPVAWSNFITGTNPGGHNIFDFIHREPETYMPYLSTSRSESSHKTISIGDYVVPLSGGKIELLREGRAFWQVLEDYDIPATVFKMPSNYPPAESKQRTLSGMGTPDILGTYGMFTYYTSHPGELKKDISGGTIQRISIQNHAVETKLFGPPNSFKKDSPETYIDFKVYIDPVNPIAKVSIQGNEFILKQGEWSDWVKVDFPLIPTQHVSGICKFYLKSIRPKFNLYVTPLNINPEDPAMPIVTPDSYGKELVDRFGYFWTKGLPADTKALEHGVLDEEEFLAQDDGVLGERGEIFDYELGRFESGLLFYYVSSTDQRQHMFWRLIDEQHPGYDKSLASKFSKTIESIYVKMDQYLAKAMKKADKDTVIIVMSDHGFMPFRRSFNLNTWLKENGYLKLINERRQGEEEFFLNTNWDRTQAYALGLNGLYINEQERERDGTVPGNERKALVREIAQKLEQVKDPKTGERVVHRAYPAEEVYSGPFAANAPDIIVGYNKNFRASWATPLGRIPLDVFEDNTDKWSGDHCMSHELLPGIVLANKPLVHETPALQDVTATIYKVFGIDKPEGVTGNSIF
jgi:predicted AlkP superfamily phosphohydrolase/phosphomutase